MVIAMPEDVIHRKRFAYEPVCGVLAVAVATGVKFVEAYTFIAKFKRSNWKGSTTTFDQTKAIKHFGCNYEHKNIKDFGLGEVNHWYSKKISLRKLVGVIQLIDPKSIYLISTTNHAQVVQGSYVIDQSGKVHISKYHFAGRRVRSVNKIINPNFDESKVPDIVKETIEMTARENTKTSRAFAIFNRESALGKKRKEILAIMTDELETTWGTASTMYHKAKKNAEQSNETVQEAEAIVEATTNFSIEEEVAQDAMHLETTE